MTLPGWLRALLPAQTQQAWERVRDVVPVEAYLVGGTALAVHLRHRVSRDLDFFLPRPSISTLCRRACARSARSS